MRGKRNCKRLFLPLSLALLLISSAAFAGPPRCFLHGIITPRYDSNEPTSLSDMIRMHFDADNKAKCEAMITSYCNYNVKNKRYSPVRLKGSFKPDVQKSEEFTYTFNESCKLLKEE